MIISRTPFRISFAGGGTDLASFYQKEEGKVISATIDKYIYVVVKKQSNIVEHKYRINWSTVEFKNRIEEIEHPIVRHTLALMNIDFPIEITTFADIPAGTGLGSSSSFTVGLLHALFALKGQMVTKNTLAKMAADIEINLLKRNIGKQDHYAASYGNINIFSFYADDNVSVNPVFYQAEIKDKIENNLMLFYTKTKRDASNILKNQHDNPEAKRAVLSKMKAFVLPLENIFSSGDNIDSFGEILHQSWLLKRSIAPEISSAKIDKFYQTAINVGALGGKLLGAGSGGFLLFYVPPDKQPAVTNQLQELIPLPFKFDVAGTRITYYDQTIL